MPLGHGRVHEARAHDEHPHPGAGEGVAEALGEGVEACLGRAVDVVPLPRPLAGDRREHDDGAVALDAQAVGDVQQGRHRSAVVGDDRLRRRRRVVVEALLVAEHPGGEDDGVEVASRAGGGEGGVDRGAVALDVGGVPVDDLDPRGVGVPQAGGDGSHGFGPAPGQHDDVAAVTHEPFGDGGADVGRAAEDEEGLDPAEGVTHRRRLLVQLGDLDGEGHEDGEAAQEGGDDQAPGRHRSDGSGASATCEHRVTYASESMTAGHLLATFRA